MYWPGTGSCHAHTVPRNHISEVSSSYLEDVLAHMRETSSGSILAACGRFGFSRGVHRCTDSLKREYDREHFFLDLRISLLGLSECSARVRDRLASL